MFTIDMYSEDFKKYVNYEETEDEITRTVKGIFKKNNNKTLERSHEQRSFWHFFW